MDSFVQISQTALYLSYAAVPNWGFAILLLTFAVRLALLPLQVFSMREQKKLAALKPTLDALQEKYRGDAGRLLAERSLVLKNAGVRTWSSLIAALVQLPIFFAVFTAISNTPELANVGFAWLPNLAAPDPLFLLPSLLAVVVWIQSRPGIATTDTPKALRFAMPVVSFMFIATMPAGVALYSVMNSLGQLITQKVF